MLAKNWKQPNGVTDKQIIIYPHNEILLNNKRNELLLYVTRWMKLKGIMLSKKQAFKNAYYVVPFT